VPRRRTARRATLRPARMNTAQIPSYSRSAASAFSWQVMPASRDRPSCGASSARIVSSSARRARSSTCATPVSWGLCDKSYCVRRLQWTNGTVSFSRQCDAGLASGHPRRRERQSAGFTNCSRFPVPMHGAVLACFRTYWPGLIFTVAGFEMRLIPTTRLNPLSDPSSRVSISGFVLGSPL
jgi:hypothetical protein